MSEERGESPGAALLRWLLLLASLGWFFALLHRGFPLSWDEIEFFRATRWIAEGRVPFRDFWEHHTPLLWAVFAPVAALTGGGPGVAAVVALRWAQLPVWGAVLVIAIVLSRRCGVGRTAGWIVLLLVLTSGSFVSSALQYRVEALGGLGFLAALLVAGAGGNRPRNWLAFGASMSIAVLANMRLAPLVVFAALLMLAWDSDGSRWRLRPGAALWILAGVFLVAVPFVGWLLAIGAWEGFADGVLRYNAISNRWVSEVANTFVPQLLAPLRSRDISGIALWISAAAGLLLTLRGLRRPGPPQIAALLFAASVAGIAAAGIQYPYHFVIAYLLMVPLAGMAIQYVLRFLTRPALLMLIPASGLLVQATPLLRGTLGAGMAYQDLVMHEVDRVTLPGQRVWDGTGYALRREPAYRYWFLPAGVRHMAREGIIEPYDLEQAIANPPAAVIYNQRVQLWLLEFPRLGTYLSRHYLPLYRNLWIPGLSGTLRPGIPTVWIVPAAGRYRVWASEVLASHPWMSRPHVYGVLQGEDATLMEVPLARLPAVSSGSIEWVVDGRSVGAGPDVLDLRQGSRVEARSRLGKDVGVIAAPERIRVLFRAPEERFVF